jgi:deoxycytidylate deaminase
MSRTVGAWLTDQTFIVATNFNGQGPIPDAQNFAVGYIVVA